MATLALTLSATFVSLLLGVPGVLATVVFAMPPAVRMTAMGILQVDRELVEAGEAFGATRWQLLFKVQLPLALPSLMGGVNQTIMMALSMVIVLVGVIGRLAFGQRLDAQALIGMGLVILGVVVMQARA